MFPLTALSPDIPSAWNAFPHDLLSHLLQVFAKASHLPNSFPDYLYSVQMFPLPSQYNLPELFYILVAVRWI